eukprot:TRINITY_DN34093_c0_g1_i1.p1 TRINITY_DN34093_c0_g1~~TRINITY_DN34093_c0_g1_i1.p1  ORF type:complete len:711 (-),score=64.47 TRINITY_DN34093_c0_g1_i1:60-2192(-)
MMLVQTLCLLSALPLLVGRRVLQAGDGDTDGEVPEEGTHAIDLCSEKIVEKGCSRFRAVMESRDEVTLLQAVEETLSAKSLSESFWEALGLPADLVDCEDLCRSVTKYIDSVGVLPPANDIACYNVGMETICDAYVGEEVLHTFGPADNENLPNFHDEEVTDELYRHMDADSQAQAVNISSFLEQATSLDDLTSDFISYTDWQAAERVASFFHIYPSPAPQEDEDDAGWEMGEEGFEGGSPEHGTDEPFFRDDEEPLPKNVGEWPDGGERLTQKKNAEARTYIGAAIKHFERRATKTQMDRWFGKETFQSELSRRQILRIMNSVQRMLGMVVFFPRGPKCRKKTFAYVYPRSSTCKSRGELYTRPCTKLNDKYVFYLCNHYFEKPREQIETLVHEGSHHATAYTQDVEFRGEKAYGRVICQLLARNDAPKARNNADSFCYYIQDIANQLGTTPSKPSLVRVRSATLLPRPPPSCPAECGGDRVVCRIDPEYCGKCSQCVKMTRVVCGTCALRADACSRYSHTCGDCPMCTTTTTTTTTTLEPITKPTPPASCPAGSLTNATTGECECPVLSGVYQYCYQRVSSRTSFVVKLGCTDRHGKFGIRTFSPTCATCRCQNTLYTPQDQLVLDSYGRSVSMVIVDMKGKKTKVFTDGVKRRCCCKERAGRQLCELVQHRKQGCGQEKGRGWHSWNNMGWFTPASIHNYGQCVIKH